jgi:hypothetical protein
VLDLGFGVTINSEKVYDLHFLLLICEVLVIWFLSRSFSKEL